MSVTSDLLVTAACARCGRSLRRRGIRFCSADCREIWERDKLFRVDSPRPGPWQPGVKRSWELFDGAMVERMLDAHDVGPRAPSWPELAAYLYVSRRRIMSGSEEETLDLRAQQAALLSVDASMVTQWAAKLRNNMLGRIVCPEWRVADWPRPRFKLLAEEILALGRGRDGHRDPETAYYLGW